MHAALVLRDVLLDRPVTLALAVAEVVAFVDQHQPVSPELGQFPDGHAEGEHLGPQAVLLPVVLPHRHEVLRADDERLEVVVILEDAGHGGGHERLAEANHVADQHAAALVEVVGGDLDRCFLELEQLVPEVPGNLELGQSPARASCERW